MLSIIQDVNFVTYQSTDISICGILKRFLMYVKLIVEAIMMSVRPVALTRVKPKYFKQSLGLYFTQFLKGRFLSNAAKTKFAMGLFRPVLYQFLFLA